jgi:hypothetical protein
MASESYRRCCTSVEWPGQTLAARLMRAEKHWNHDPYFDYVDRWMTEDHAEELKEIRKASETNDSISFPNHWNVTIERAGRPGRPTFFRQMWDKYRNNLPPAKTILQ